ncbi:MAG TPA: flavin reductase family protein [Candidatus Lachnoclostridium stercoravium]|uniref:Flavin reductase family protein n=1 Tax=Candidatus Lachnoclostridium stercoravium TaxID=2838633 RepID=A0A9D2HGR4_9FIRM|nr:flavin reductase family protein [Candidatus Lachnoclostridium stercoravium]
MGKYAFKPGNMIYPVPAVLVSAADREGNTNIFTAAWTGTICTNPPMAYISVRPERYSYHMIRETGEFVINLTTKELARAADYCGVRSGRDVDKWKEMKLTPVKGREVSVPLIGESPVNIECRVTEVKELGSHHMFLAQVVAVSVDEAYMDENGRFDLNASGLIAYSHGQYRELGENLGGFGFSVQKNAKKSGKPPAKRNRQKDNRRDSNEKKRDIDRNAVVGQKHRRSPIG